MPFKWLSSAPLEEASEPRRWCCGGWKQHASTSRASRIEFVTHPQPGAFAIRMRQLGVAELVGQAQRLL
eukprot:CAMPEP_0198554372 /NCGR_PEP_ID=MMETSP1462-20131121/82365_1 /TAXON_ID=1333877 /ORGANISM="Brandtodinium nutriculum, Strain RCC3387" /LENGTH=68 /DNA_ID=CAMNT_0044285073 /DNA_START=44 /DNA_END=247 /DNA_ORIENTATION=+